jgi:class 3 adenylate cyclase
MPLSANRQGNQKMADRKLSKAKPEIRASEMELDQLRRLLKERGDAVPKYLFDAVEEKNDLRDYRYVFWLDLMGARNLMKLSLPRAARSVMKIHAAALLAKEKHRGLSINPVMDGVYGFVRERAVLETCLTDILAALGNVFVQERVSSSRFMVRAGVAFGPIVPGTALAEGALILKRNRAYLGGTAIGMAISHAYEAESCAPPFGVYIHESARAFAPRTEGAYPYRVNLWRWFKDHDPLTWAMRRTLVHHFDWVGKNPAAAQYETEAYCRHRALAVEYFKLYELTSQYALRNPASNTAP